MSEAGSSHVSDENLAKREADELERAINESKALERGLTTGAPEDDELARALRESLEISKGLPPGARRLSAKEREISELEMIMALSREDALARGEAPPAYAVYESMREPNSPDRSRSKFFGGPVPTTSQPTSFARRLSHRPLPPLPIHIPSESTQGSSMFDSPTSHSTAPTTPTGNNDNFKQLRSTNSQRDLRNSGEIEPFIIEQHGSHGSSPIVASGASNFLPPTPAVQPVPIKAPNTQLSQDVPAVAVSPSDNSDGESDTDTVNEYPGLAVPEDGASIAGLSAISERTEPRTMYDNRSISEASSMTYDEAEEGGTSSPAPWWTNNPEDVLSNSGSEAMVTAQSHSTDQHLSDYSQSTIEPATAAVNEMVGSQEPFGDGVRFGYIGDELTNVAPFPEAIALGREGNEEEGRATFVLEAMTWSGLLRFLMWQVY